MAIILVADGNSLDRTLLSSLLTDQGHRVLEAADGCAAATMAHSALPDLVLMELELPLLDGMQATRIIKSSSMASDIPIIALTSQGTAGQRTRCMEAGCADFDTKPIDEEQLQEKIDAALSARSPAFVRMLAAQRPAVDPAEARAREELDAARAVATSLRDTLDSTAAERDQLSESLATAQAAYEQELSTLKAELEQCREEAAQASLVVEPVGDSTSQTVVDIEVLRFKLESKELRLERLERAFSLLQSTVRHAMDAAYQDVLFKLAPELPSVGHRVGTKDAVS